jgi:hypothetical protein
MRRAQLHGASALVDEMQAIEMLNLEDLTWLVATPHRSRCMRPRSTSTFTALLHVQIRNTNNITQLHALTKHSAGNGVLMEERLSVLRLCTVKVPSRETTRAST